MRTTTTLAWGRLSVNDGWIQRSAVPPSFLAAGRFYEWFLEQEIPLIDGNGVAQ